MEEDAQDRVCVCGVGGGMEVYALRAPLSPNLHVFVQTLFGGFYGGFITQAQLMKSLAVGDCFNGKPFSLSQTWWEWGGARSSNPLTMWLVPLASSPLL